MKLQGAEAQITFLAPRTDDRLLLPETAVRLQPGHLLLAALLNQPARRRPLRFGHLD
jgi:hypothetical protein